MNPKAVIIWMGLTALVSACGPLMDRPSYEEQKSYSLDGVKLITPSIRRGDDPSTFLQPEFRVGPDRRLLLRFESLKDHMSDVKTDESQNQKYKVEMRLTLVQAAQQADAIASFKLCPILTGKPWMQAATWKRVDPFDTWDNEGGDFDAEGCVRSEKSGDADLVFNITDWFKNYARGRKSNQGLILIPDSGYFTVVGTRGGSSGAHSPRMSWIAGN
jgi:hypothetical protein